MAGGGVMAPNKVRKALLKRLAYLDVKLASAAISVGVRSMLQDEHEALLIVLIQCGLYDQVRYERYRASIQQGRVRAEAAAEDLGAS